MNTFFLMVCGPSKYRSCHRWNTA